MHKAFISVVISLACFCLQSLSMAQAENLLDIYRLALTNDSAYQAAKNEFLSIQENKEQSFALFLPALSFSANYTNIDQTNTVSGVDTTYDYTSKNYSLSLRQMLYRHDYFVQHKQAGLQELQASANFNKATQDLIVRVAENYFQILGATDNLDFANAEKKAIAEQLNQAKQRFEVGLTAITDVHEAQSRYDQAVAQAIAAENQLAISRENLHEIIYQYPDKLASLSRQNPLLRPEPEDINAWVEMAIAQNLSLLASEKTMNIAREEISRNRAGHYPTLDLVASHGISSTDGGALVNLTGRDQEETQIGLQLNLSLYEGGLVSSKTRQTAHLYNQSKELYEQQRRTTERLTRSAYLNVLSNISQVKAFKQALQSSKTALEATEAGYEVGTRTAVDVLNAHREVFRAERDYANSRYNYILETLRLKQAAGSLNEDDIQSINLWLK
ncbi:MAG: TolC family outer membrane protein [Gammaproteobacteria bacterium]|nr:TolC family outer membrane protein [Gammaproteobacteria bacterium]